MVSGANTKVTILPFPVLPSRPRPYTSSHQLRPPACLHDRRSASASPAPTCFETRPVPPSCRDQCPPPIVPWRGGVAWSTWSTPLSAFPAVAQRWLFAGAYCCRPLQGASLVQLCKSAFLRVNFEKPQKHSASPFKRDPIPLFGGGRRAAGNGSKAKKGGSTNVKIWDLVFGILLDILSLYLQRNCRILPPFLSRGS